MRQHRTRKVPWSRIAPVMTTAMRRTARTFERRQMRRKGMTSCCPSQPSKKSIPERRKRNAQSVGW